MDCFAYAEEPLVRMPSHGKLCTLLLKLLSRRNGHMLQTVDRIKTATSHEHLWLEYKEYTSVQCYHTAHDL